MLAERCHPDRIDEFLIECGIPESELDATYDELNLRRSHILSCWSMKRTMRIVGVLLVLLSVVFFFSGLQGQTIFIPIGLFVYGVAVAITGNLAVFER